MRKGQLGEFLTLQRGFDITVAQQVTGKVPVVSSSGIKSFHNEAKVRGPGVVIGRKGTLGNAYYIEEDFWPHDTTLWVKDFKGNNPLFCMYLLKSLDLGRYDVGASNPTLNRNHVHQIEVNFPDLTAQDKIVSKVSKFDRLINCAEGSISYLTELLLQNFNFITAKASAIRPLSECIEQIESGSRPKGGADANGTVPSIGAENIIGLGRYNYSSEKYVSQDFYTRLKKGKVQDLDVMLYKDGAYIGRTSIFGGTFPHPVACINEHVYRLRAIKNIGQLYLFSWLALKDTFQDIQRLNTNAAQPGLRKDKVLSLKIPIVDQQTIDEFNLRGTKVVRLAFNLATQVRLLSNTRDKLVLECLERGSI